MKCPRVSPLPQPFSEITTTILSVRLQIAICQNWEMLTQQKSHKDRRSPGPSAFMESMKGEPGACELKNVAHLLSLKNKMHFLILNNLSTTKTCFTSPGHLL